jgi:hypothetical protein
MGKNEYKSGQIGKYAGAIAQKYNLNPEEVRLFLLGNFPELKDKKHCANCQAGMKMFWHMMSPGLVGCLIKAIEFVKINKNHFHLTKDLNLSKTEYNNFQKLRFHGLIAHSGNKAGYWLITKRGGSFLRDEIEIPDGVKTFRNKVEGHSEKMIKISDFRGKFPSFQSEFAYEFKK